MGSMGLRVALVLCVALFACAQCEEDEPVGGMLGLIQVSESVPQVAEMDAEEFAGLMNKIIHKASEMRGVMNKLGISDTDSVRKVEQHFIRLGEQHHDLGDGATSEEELRLHGLRARSCVKHAVTCSHMAASCHATPKHCKAVVENCSRAAAACGVADIGESEKDEDEDEKATADHPEPKHWEKSKPEKGFLPNPTPAGYFHKKKMVKKKVVKKKEAKKKATKKAKHAPAIELIEEEAGEDDHDLARFQVDDDSEALESELSEAEA